jgi:hypothetical protein
MPAWYVRRKTPTGKPEGPKENIIITSSLSQGGTFNIGSAASPSTLTLATTAYFTHATYFDVSNVAINDLIRDGTSRGTLQFIDVNVELTNPNNSYSGGTAIDGATLPNSSTLAVSSDGSLGAATSPLSISYNAVFLALSTFSSARPIIATSNINASPVIDVTGTNVLTLTGRIVGSLTKGTNSGTVVVTKSSVGDIVVNGGGLVVNGNAGGQITVNDGSLVVGGSAGGQITVNDGSLALTAPSDITPSALKVNAGSCMLGSSTGIATDPKISVGPGATLQFMADAAQIHGSISVSNGGSVSFGPRSTPVAVSLNIGDGGSVVFSPSPGTAVIHGLGIPNLNNSGRLDIGNAGFSYISENPGSVPQYLKAGYNGGSWNGTGAAIVSSSAAASAGTRSVGWVGASTINTVKYTTSGDVDLSGRTDFNDFMTLQNHYQSAGVWQQGDLNYDGVVDQKDFAILKKSYGDQIPGPIVTPAIRRDGGIGLPQIVLSINDDGKGHPTPGHFAIYIQENSFYPLNGIASYSVDVQGFSSVSNVAPQGFYDDGTGTGKTIAQGFTLLRSPDAVTGLASTTLTGSQDTIDDPSTVRLIYDMGLASGNLDAIAPAGSTGGTDKTQTVYSAELLVATGTFADPSQLMFTSDRNLDNINVFRTNAGEQTQYSSVNIFTQTLAVPEPVGLGVGPLIAGGLLRRRKRRK